MGEYYLEHSGRSKRNGAKVGSGRYPLGSGARPYQDYPQERKRFKTKSLKSKYVNENGTLTKKGAERWEQDIRNNKSKKKENRIDVSEPDPDRWVREDLGRTDDVLSSTGRVLSSTKRIVNKIPEKKRKRQDLSHLTDQEMRDRINRERLEREYDNMFPDLEEQKVNRGKEYTMQVLDVLEPVVAIGSGIVGIITGIHLLKNG